MLAFNSIVAVYDTQTGAETGLKHLERDGFDLNKVSILGREHESRDQVTGCYSTGSHMKHWGARGTFWNGLWKSLSGGAYFAIPEVGGVLIAGPLTVWIVDALQESVADDLSPVGAGLFSISIPKAAVVRYESAVKMHKLLLIGYGSAPELLRSRDALRDSSPEEISVHFAEEGIRSAA